MTYIPPVNCDDSDLPDDETWERWMREQELRALNEHRSRQTLKDQHHAD